jgi:UDP-glucose 4-epimerase
MGAEEHALSGTSRVLSCGYGRGFSVREILGAVRGVSGVEFGISEEPRREGDSPTLVAYATRIREVLGWKPVRDGINVICEFAYRWEKNERA